MTPERFRQIRNVFEAALERDEDTRTDYLSQACQGDEDLRLEIDRLLDAYRRPAALFQGDAGRMEGRIIGHYRILRELGRGGMGSVYLAVRIDDLYRKPIALKVVRPEAGSEEVIQRFRQEREILAGLDHPHIARLLDGGATPEGLPYFIMDYVDGRPIDEYCDERLLSVSEREKLFQSVCSAVEYAHRRGIVHRDLKPGNILVTGDGVVKLLDFGIAKLLHTNADDLTAYITRTGFRLMTPEYASPEQVKGELVDERSDVYSLGVILYELLTGHRPYRMRSRVMHEVVRVICEEEPTRPSSVVSEVGPPGVQDAGAVTPEGVSRTRETTPSALRSELSGDLDNILLKALRKDPIQRYRSVRELSEDVQRRLDGLPVLVQKHSLAYRSKKLLYRYRGWTLAAFALAVGLLTGAVRISPWARGLLVIFGAALIFGSHLRKMEYGPAIAHSEIFQRAVFLIVCFSGAIATTKLLPNPRQFWLFVSWILIAVCLMYLARWPLRKRWSGALILDLTRSRSKAAQVWGTAMGIAVLLGCVAALMEQRYSGKTNLDSFSNVFPTAAFGAYFYFMWGRVEMHRRGILHQGRLLRWSKIESYSWDAGQGAHSVLKLRLRRLAFLRLPERIMLPASRKNEVDAILHKQLSEWPGGTAA